MHNLDEVDRRLLDRMRQERQVHGTHVEEERRLHHKRLHERRSKEDGQTLDEEFQRLLGEEDGEKPNMDEEPASRTVSAK